MQVSVAGDGSAELGTVEQLFVLEAGSGAPAPSVFGAGSSSVPPSGFFVSGSGAVGVAGAGLHSSGCPGGFTSHPKSQWTRSFSFFRWQVTRSSPSHQRPFVLPEQNVDTCTSGRQTSGTPSGLRSQPLSQRVR